METAAVVIAAGYGSFRGNGPSAFPKVLEDIYGRPMVVRVLDTVREVGFSPRILVVNPRDREMIARAVRNAGHPDVIVVQQEERRGTVDALGCAVTRLPAEAQSALVTYADMSLWQVSQMRRLAAAHREDYAVTMLTLYTGDHHCPTQLCRYGVVMWDTKGRVCRVLEPEGAHPPAGKTVNPSLWIWNVPWFRTQAHLALAVPKGDGFSPEHPLPGMLPIAYAQGLHVEILTMHEDYWTALGVNTAEELALVRKIFDEKHRVA